MKQISSRDNPDFRQLLKLHQRRYREQTGLFLAEGEKFLDYPDQLDTVILSQDRTDQARFSGISCPVLELSPSLFKELSRQENSQGVIAVCRLSRGKADPKAQVTVVGDELRDPGNLGTLIRTMDAAGFDQLILTRGSVDAWNDKTVRASMGSIFHIRICYMSVEELNDWLRINRISGVTTSLNPGSLDYRAAIWDFPLALILGNESRGVSSALSTPSDLTVHIPIYGQAESLNVSVSAAVLLYQLRTSLEQLHGN